MRKPYSWAQWFRSLFNRWHHSEAVARGRAAQQAEWIESIYFEDWRRKQ